MPQSPVETIGVALDPLDTYPLRWPTANPRQLSEDAQLLYYDGMIDKPINRNWFEERTYREQPGYVPTERDLAAIKELVDGGLAHYNAERRDLHPTPVHPQYTVARGNGPYLAKVFAAEKYRETPSLLATLIGAETNSVSGLIAEVQLSTRHATATDDEHDRSRTSHLTLVAPTAVDFSHSGQLSFHATLVEACLYPLGVDPLLLDEDGQRRRDADEHPVLMCTLCDGSQANQEPHPIAPYRPNQLTTLPGSLLVRVDLLPIRAYTITG